MYELTQGCRICGAGSLSSVFDLGSQPPANHLRLAGEPIPELVPLDLRVCDVCTTAQITATVQPEELFSNYVWVTGTSIEAQNYSRQFYEQVDEIVSNSLGDGPNPDQFVIEIASNDGTVLQQFREHGWRLLGVEPAKNIAETAIAHGVPTVVEFFGTELADELVDEHGYADVVIARNVIPHVANIDSVIEGLATLAGDKGVVIIEFHSAEVIIEQLHYDSIYHEHLYYFSFDTLCSLCEQYGLYPFDTFDSPISGGSLVVGLSRHHYPVSEKCGVAAGLGRRLRSTACSRWREFAAASQAHARSLKEIVVDHAEANRVVGYGASARSSTMLNYAGITADEVVAVIDQNPYKQGRYTPGTNIPIVAREDGLGLLGPEDVILLLAWNFADEILDGLRADGVSNRVIVPLPGQVRTI